MDDLSNTTGVIVAIHQPNYVPWLGYFAKLARAGIFVFLDDVQFSKGSYTNRVRIARAGEPVWLSVPVRHDSGATIGEIMIARDDWARAHRDALHQAYRHARAFHVVWPVIDQWLDAFRTSRLAEVNMGLIRAIAGYLGLSTHFVTSSALAINAESADVRLAAITARLAPGGTYLSGSGGARYQDEGVFRAAGLCLMYSDFTPRPYERSGEPFLPGLSIVDALFHLGPERTAELLQPKR